MNEIQIRTAGLEDRAFIRSVAECTWPSTYGAIISQAQIDFMLDWMYSNDALAQQMNTGAEFYIASIKKINDQWEEVGFCSVSPEKEEGAITTTYKLNKLYVLPTAQGSGAGKALLDKAIEVAKLAGAPSMFLQVNKLNSAYTFYLKKGFIKEADFKFDIGNGFFMDDYVMRLHF